MSKKLIILALTAISAAAFALPGTASAIVPLHVTGASSYPDAFTIVGGVAKLSTEGGLTVECQKVKSTNTTNFTNSTEGNLRLTFESECKENLFGTKCTSAGETAGSIKTEQLTFKLATIQRTGETKVPGVLVGPPASGILASFVCGGGLVSVTVKGNVLGRVTLPQCEKEASLAEVVFETTVHGIQKYTTLESTATEFTLEKGSEMAAQEGLGELKFAGNRKLVCT